MAGQLNTPFTDGKLKGMSGGGSTSKSGGKKGGKTPPKKVSK